MTFVHLANLMQNWGWEVKPEYYAEFDCYLKEMLRRKRVMVITGNDLIEAVIFFFFVDDYESFYKKGTYETPEDSIYGKQIYIDKMICRKWTLGLSRKIKETVEVQFPWVEEGYYHRAPKDRCVRIKRRGVIA